jgi:hypothetical protein
MEGSVWFTKIRPRVDADVQYNQWQNIYEPLIDVSPYSEDAIDGCLSLGNANLTRGLLIRELDKPRTSFDRDHFYMLLGELTLASTAKLDLHHYTRWLIRKLRSSDVSIDTRRLFSDAAKSILDPVSVTHYSPMFTAYSGFLLLALSSDWKAILQTMIDEPGVTSYGLDLAGMLIGAYLGRMEVDEQRLSTAF